jgi:hypothetical protein
MSFSGKKIWERKKKKRGKCKIKWRNRERKRRKEERKEKIGSKRVKYMQNREKLRQKGHDRSTFFLKRPRGGENIIFRKVGGINIIFGPKDRPLP